MEDEIDVYRVETAEGKVFMITTYRIVLPDDIEGQESVVVPLCEVECVEKNNTPFTNTLLLYTHKGDVHKIRFRTKKDVQTLADIISFLIQELKVGTRQEGANHGALFSQFPPTTGFTRSEPIRYHVSIGNPLFRNHHGQGNRQSRTAPRQRELIRDS